MKKLFLLFFYISLFPVLLSGNTVICGKIKNFSRSKLTVHISNSNDITFNKYEEEFTIELTKDGYFHKELPEIDYPRLTNYIQLGSDKIFFGIYPSDSLYISVDYKDIPNSLSFKGIGADKNYFIHNYLSLLSKEAQSKTVRKMTYPDYKQFKEASLKNNLMMLAAYQKKYTLDTSYISLQRQEIIFNFYNDVATFDKKRMDEPYLECYDTANLINNIYLKDHTLYYSVLTGYIRYKYQAENNQRVIAKEFQPYYLSGKYLNGDILEKYKAYFLLFNFTYNFSEQTIDNLKELYFDFRKNHKNKFLYDLVTEKAIDIMLIRRNE